MNLDEAKATLCSTGASLYGRGYVHASAGNISMRLDDGSFLITPTDACLGTLQAAELAHVVEGVQVSGARASKTLALHQAIYAAEPKARCIIHTHATNLVSLTLKGVWRPDDILPPITPYYVMKVGHVPLIPYQRPGHPNVAQEVSARIHAAHAKHQALRGVMLDRLGPVVWHETPAQASAVLEELEETAKLWLMSERQATALSDTDIEDLRQSFGAIW
jgi:ribulose-5-phosphate 4-epimerase/fuculose-1-phosphate aldolase